MSLQKTAGITRLRVTPLGEIHEQSSLIESHAEAAGASEKLTTFWLEAIPCSVRGG